MRAAGKNWAERCDGINGKLHLILLSVLEPSRRADHLFESAFQAINPGVSFLHIDEWNAPQKTHKSSVKKRHLRVYILLEDSDINLLLLKCHSLTAVTQNYRFSDSRSSGFSLSTRNA